MEFLYYLVQVNLYLILFYSFYRLVLFGETFHNLNRAYLVLSALLSFGIPLWYSEYVQSWFITREINEVLYTIYDPSVILIRPTSKISFTWADILEVLYIIGISIFSVRLIITLMQLIIVLKNKNFEKFTAFSFFGYSFVDETLRKRDTILAHEHVHIQQLHSADVMIFEIIAILNWFNPVVYLYKKDIKHIHEFIADDIAAQNEKSKLDYAMLLFTQEFGLQPDQLTNSFFTHSTLKRRIQMLSKPKSHRIMILKYWLSVPLFVLMLVLSSAGIAKNKVLDLVEVQLSDLNKKSIGIERHTDNFSEETVVITDARIISGKVTTATDGRPLPGVDVEVIGKKRGTSTDADGHFKISASEGEKLRFSFLGFETAVVEVGSKTTIDIALKMKQPERVALNEVKVTTSKKTVWGHDELIFESVDENPEYPGGVKQMYEFIADNIKYPMEAERNEISGKVFVKFIVRKDGSISDLKVLKGIGSGCDEETIRVLSQMPKWTPGKHNGEPVNVMFTMPVNFELNYEKHANGVALPRSSDTFKLRGINGKEQIFILDGKEIKKEELNQLEPGKIETVTVLKDNEAVKIYGEKGRDGVIIIKTKLFPEQTKK